MQPVINVHWVGHATVIVEVGGRRIMTDPAVTTRLAHLRRRVSIPVLAPADVVLISHVHMDHLHQPSLRRAARDARVIVPRGARSLVAKVGAGSVEEVDHGATVSIAADLRVEVVPANHLRGRGPHSKVTAEPQGFVIDAAGTRIYFAGDTDLFDAMSTLGPLDLALVPIWGWGPTLGERHLDPSSAAEAVRRLDPVRVVPIHWGTYSPVRLRRGAPAWLDRPVEEFRLHLEAAGLGDRLVTLEPGGSLQL
jgi:L-ascorbate metabolism protein UlaG (beta-lactamase superfamily)